MGSTFSIRYKCKFLKLGSVNRLCTELLILSGRYTMDRHPNILYIYSVGTTGLPAPSPVLAIALSISLLSP